MLSSHFDGRGRTGGSGTSTAKRTAKKAKTKKKAIDSYDHRGKKRPNNPPVGLVTPETDKDTGKKTYEYDPHLDPQLVWAGKAEHTSFEVPTVSLHVHERIDPKTIIEAVRKRLRAAAERSFGDPVAELQLVLGLREGGDDEIRYGKPSGRPAKSGLW